VRLPGGFAGLADRFQVGGGLILRDDLVFRVSALRRLSLRGLGGGLSAPTLRSGVANNFLVR